MHSELLPRLIGLDAAPELFATHFGGYELLANGTVIRFVLASAQQNGEFSAVARIIWPVFSWIDAQPSYHAAWEAVQKNPRMRTPLLRPATERH